MTYLPASGSSGDDSSVQRCARGVEGGVDEEGIERRSRRGMEDDPIPAVFHDAADDGDAELVTGDEGAEAAFEQTAFVDSDLTSSFAERDVDVRVIEVGY